MSALVIPFPTVRRQERKPRRPRKMPPRSPGQARAATFFALQDQLIVALVVTGEHYKRSMASAAAVRAELLKARDIIASTLPLLNDDPSPVASH